MVASSSLCRRGAAPLLGGGAARGEKPARHPASQPQEARSAIDRQRTSQRRRALPPSCTAGAQRGVLPAAAGHGGHDGGAGCGEAVWGGGRLRVKVQADEEHPQVRCVCAHGVCACDPEKHAEVGAKAQVGRLGRLLSLPGCRRLGRVSRRGCRHSQQAEAAAWPGAGPHCHPDPWGGGFDCCRPPLVRPSALETSPARLRATRPGAAAATSAPS